MDQGALTDVLDGMIAAGGIQRLPARTPWPMHRALRLMYSEAGRRGSLALLPPAPEFLPCPESGLAAEGAEQALRALIDRGLVTRVGTGMSAALAVDSAAAIAARRRLLGRDPRTVELLQRAGERWAAFASTAAKYSDAPERSSGSIVLSGAA